METSLDEAPESAEPGEPEIYEMLEAGAGAAAWLIEPDQAEAHDALDASPESPAEEAPPVARLEELGARIAAAERGREAR